MTGVVDPSICLTLISKMRVPTDPCNRPLPDTADHASEGLAFLVHLSESFPMGLPLETAGCSCSVAGILAGAVHAKATLADCCDPFLFDRLRCLCKLCVYIYTHTRMFLPTFLRVGVGASVVSP